MQNLILSIWIDEPISKPKVTIVLGPELQCLLKFKEDLR